MEKSSFVARMHELNRLEDFLKQAVDGKGSVCLVTGEAGSGKTTLVAEFARRSQEQHDDLVVVSGQSDAQTGMSDAYLPFREVLTQITGDVESKLSKGAITKENAGRLKRILGISGQVLVDLGPDLIDIFVPGAKLAARAGTLVAKKVGWIDRLEKLTEKRKIGASLVAQGIEAAQIYEQYANVLCKLSEKHPLLVVLDDLQWADTASIELLFHLARRIEANRILILGTYRPEEVSIGRAGARHPLEKVLSELKRYYGDIWVDLDQAELSEGMHFVKAFVDTEPNHLSEEFCYKLFEHTGGHALFTIELLRTLQERGDLIQDVRGMWVETPTLAWETLPKRVEGVIEERIGRLNQELRHILGVSSVEGEDFIAEVVARVQNTDVRGLISMLSEELERQHRLVQANGIRRLERTGQRLSTYRFQHNLFQRYLYNELGEAERVYLHEDIGNTLEALFTNQMDEIVVQLAHHFSEAGIPDKAQLYLERAGKQAADRYANDEAITYFTRALDLISPIKLAERFNLLRAREEVYHLQAKRDLQSKDLEIMLEIATSLNDDRKRCEVAIRQADYYHATSDYQAAISAAQHAVQLAETMQDNERQALALCEWGRAALFLGDTGASRIKLENALTLAQETRLPAIEGTVLLNLGNVYFTHAEYSTANSYFQQSLAIAREQGDQRSESKALNNLGAAANNLGDLVSARTYYDQALEISQKIGNRLLMGVLLVNLCTVTSSIGDLQAARSYGEKSLLINRETGNRDYECSQLYMNGDVAAMSGDFSSAMQLYRKSLELAHEIASKHCECLALTAMSWALPLQGKYTYGYECCQQAIQLAQEMGNRYTEVEAMINLGYIYDCVGNYPAARQVFQDCLDITKQMEFKPLEPMILTHLALLHHHVGEDDAALDLCSSALEQARQIGYHIFEAEVLFLSGHSLVSLGRYDAALDSYQECIKIRREAGQSHLEMEALSAVAHISLIQRKMAEASGYAEEILGFLASHSIDGLVEPIQVFLTCIRVLKANEDQRAAEILDSAYNLLTERAAAIDNDEIRKSYLENVKAHKELCAEYSHWFSQEDQAESLDNSVL